MSQSQPTDSVTTTVSADLEDSSNLPDYTPVSDAAFTWGAVDAHRFHHALEVTYQEVVHWRNNCFRVPNGNAGKKFVLELARLFRAAGEGSVLEGVALMAAFTLCALVLQKPSHNSKSRDHILCLEKRMKLWLDSDLNALVLEGRAIQQRFNGSSSRGGHNSDSDHRTAYSFAQLMFEGKTKPALDLFSGVHRGKKLGLNELVDADESLTMRDLLKSKHPPAAPLHHECLITDTDPALVYHPVIFDVLDGSVIRAAALRTSGAAGPSGVDAYGWRHLCTAFRSASDELCNCVAILAQRLCTSFVDPLIISSLMACRLIDLYKNPDVRPIGIGEVVRRIIDKAVLSVVGSDVQRPTGAFQLCAGQISGVEAAIHSMRTVFADDATEGMLFIDASNAFNSLNQAVALRNIQHLCPAFSTIIVNTYHHPAALYVDGSVLYSNEGTTQRDPLAMPFYALATLPLIGKLSKSVTQVWYADDASACGRLSDLCLWWDQIPQLGPPFGYFPSAKKTWLAVKSQYLELARSLFADCRVNVTADGRPYLGAAVGSPSYVGSYVSSKVDSWVAELKLLASSAVTQLHTAFSAFSRGLISKWLFIARTVSITGRLFQPLKDCIRDCLFHLSLDISHHLI